jgi:hypothetical protein
MKSTERYYAEFIFRSDSFLYKFKLKMLVEYSHTRLKTL